MKHQFQSKEDVLKSLLKWIRESRDADSLAVLIPFRFDSGQPIADKILRSNYKYVK